MQSDYLESVKKQFAYYKLLGDKTMSQLTDEQLIWQFNEESNSLSIIVKHMWGNMMSRWTDFLSTDGEKEWRKRDEEFDADLTTRDGIISKWEEGWQCLFAALDSLNDSNFDTIIYIRNQGHSVVEAINRQLAHYAYHVGQMVFLGRMQQGSNWESLSIPKGESSTYNKEKFSQEKKKTHFTDEYLGKKDD